MALKKINVEKGQSMSAEKSYQWTEEFIVGPKIRGLNINFRASQEKEEILELLKVLEKNQPRLILEIGTATGGTLFMFTSVVADDAEIISIDLPLGRYGAGYLPYRIPLMKAFARAGQKLHLLRLDSHKSETINALEAILNGRKLDFLFIDGDHSYDGVKSDFNNYARFVRPGGLIAFHDIVENDFDQSFGTQRFWKEIRNGFEYQEFIRANASNTGCGIGLIKVPKKN